MLWMWELFAHASPDLQDLKCWDSIRFRLRKLLQFPLTDQMLHQTMFCIVLPGVAVGLTKVMDLVRDLQQSCFWGGGRSFHLWTSQRQLVPQASLRINISHCVMITSADHRMYETYFELIFCIILQVQLCVTARSYVKLLPFSLCRSGSSRARWWGETHRGISGTERE